MEDVREELAFVDILLAVDVPDHLALTLHLSVAEVTDVVTAVGPFKLAVTLHLRVDELATVLILLGDFLEIIRVELTLLHPVLLPLFDAFALDLTILVELAAEFYGAVVAGFSTFTVDTVLLPSSFVLGTIAGLLEFTLSIEHAVNEVAVERAAVWENLLADALRMVVRKIAKVDRAVREGQLALTFFAAILPFAFVARAVGPLDDRVTVHLAAFPVASVAPALLLADEDAVALLVALEVIAFV